MTNFTILKYQLQLGDRRGSNLNRVQLDPDPDPNFFIGPKLGPRSIESGKFGHGPRPLEFDGSRVWIWVKNIFFFLKIFKNILYNVDHSNKII